jgi:hypothetical protein
MEPANVPADRPEGNRIPSKIGEHCKKLLKGKRCRKRLKYLIEQCNYVLVAIVTCMAKVASGNCLAQPGIENLLWHQGDPARQRERTSHRKAIPITAPTGPSPRRA